MTRRLVLRTPRTQSGRHYAVYVDPEANACVVATIDGAVAVAVAEVSIYGATVEPVMDGLETALDELPKRRFRE